ncbi:ribonuclease H-like [Stegodyphus dumicola]|uniref:ribonuclease H-like n=1 Tax=Stegodyphus dumicola TaxID=202533 RepID=UPI0015AF6039|nr:ribonuclease H-like [Stegodyphus dumicola]
MSIRNGSGLEGKIGLAFVVFYHGLEIEHAKFKLEKYNSVYQAELIAIQKTLEWLIINLNESHIITIHSDCMSVLQALSDPEQQNLNIQTIKKLVIQLEVRHQLNFYWVKAHIGCLGNERADVLAKEATMSNGIETVDVQASRRRCINIMKCDIVDKWRTNGKTLLKIICS